jgi:hypothetical protein
MAALVAVVMGWCKMETPSRVINRHSTILPFLHPLKFEVVKYEIAISTYSSKICWISRRGKHDLTIFCKGLKQKIAPGKTVHADRGYNSNLADKSMLSTPNTMDSTGLQNFKSCSRFGLETLNGRLKKYECLNQTFRHGRERQSLAFKAIIVTIQCHTDNGSELYKVQYLF